MKVIYKYGINPNHNTRTILTVPINSKLLKIGLQNDILYAWFEIEKDEQQTIKRTFYVIYTERDFEKKNMKFIQTVIYNEMHFVVHIYEEVEDFLSTEEMEI